MISSYITYAVLFSIFFLIVLFIHGLRRIFSILKNIIDIQNDYESDRHHDFNYTVNKILNIELPSVFQMEIINAFGCIIKKETLTNGTNSIDLSEQLPGIYFVKFIQEKDLQIKIIIIR